MLCEHLGEMLGLRVLSDELRCYFRKDLIDELLRKAAGILVQIQTQVVLPLILIENPVQFDEMFIQIVCYVNTLAVR